MDKPLSLRREDFVRELVRIVNQCDLPPCVALEVMRGVTTEVEALARKQYEADKAAYEKGEGDEQ